MVQFKSVFSLKHYARDKHGKKMRWKCSSNMMMVERKYSMNTISEAEKRLRFASFTDFLKKILETFFALRI